MGLFNKKQESSSALAKTLEGERMKSSIIISSIVDGVMLVDEKGLIHIFNPAAAKLSGWLAEEAVGLDYRSVIKLVDDRDQPIAPTEHPIAKIMAGKDLPNQNVILLTKSGNKNTIDMSVSPIKDGDKINGAIVIFRDVSEQKSEEKRRADFISTASHEMRTPVAAIEGYLALALNENVSKIDQKARGFLEKAHSSTQHLGQLFQDLLTSAKAEDGRLSNHPTIVEIGDFLEKLVQDLKFSAAKKGLKMEFVIGSQHQTVDLTDEQGTKVVRPLYYVNVDPDRIREVITNLFDNAVKYTDSGSVRIGLTGNNNVVQIHIADTGHGIPAEDVGHLFQKFYRVDNSATRTIGGTGLGLFICRKIIELYNGKIWVESVVDKGSTFYINLPRIATDRAEDMIKSTEQQLLHTPQPIQKI